MDPSPLIRAGLRRELAGDPSIIPIDVDDLASALPGWRGANPDVAVIGIGPRAHRDHIISDIRGIAPTVQVVALIQGDDDQALTRAARAGACAVITPEAGRHDLVAAIHAAAEGRTGELVLSQFRRPSQGASELDGLTPRQLDVVGLLVQGLPRKAIAQRLGIGDGTVKTYLRVIFRHLGVRTRMDAVLTLHRLGLAMSQSSGPSAHAGDPRVGSVPMVSPHSHRSATR